MFDPSSQFVSLFRQIMLNFLISICPFYRFNSGDLSTAASRQVPALPPLSKNSNAPSATSSSPPPFYARFRQSTSPLMNDDASLIATTSRKSLDKQPSQSFLQINNLKSDKKETSDTLLPFSSAGVDHVEQKKEEDNQQQPKRPRHAIPSLSIKSGDDP